MNYLTPCDISIRLIDKLESLDIGHQLDFAQINQAISWAKKYHDGQFRKSGEPYYTHPLEVAYIISDYLLKTDVIVASILHDIVEDTEVTAGMILDAFGRRIEEMVDRLTRDRPDGSKLSVEEILDNAFRAQDKEVILIKVIDRLHNVSTLQCIEEDKKHKILSETLDNFMIPAIHYGYYDIEKQLWRLYCTYKVMDSKLLLFQDSTLMRKAPSLLSQVYKNAKYPK